MYVYTYIYSYVFICLCVCMYMYICMYIYYIHVHQGSGDGLDLRGYLMTVVLQTFLDGYCCTVQGLLDWFEVDLGFTELLFIQIDLCVMCVFVLYSPVSLFSCPCLDILHCLPHAVGVPLESALNLVSHMSPCGAYDTHSCCARRNHRGYLMTVPNDST